MGVRLKSGLFASAAAALLSPCAAGAQPSYPPIETIDVYGLRTIPEDRLRSALPFKVGDATEGLPEDAVIQRALGVANVDINLVCCGPGGGTQIYVGVQESEVPPQDYLERPTGDIRLPDDVVASYEVWNQALFEAVRAGQAGEDHSEGHSLSVHPGMRAEQERFIAFAARDRDLLVEVLNGSSSAQHRAIAAHVLGYVADKPAVVDELSRAMFDPNESVRNSATRALGVMAHYASTTPDTGIEIDPEPYVAMLDSIVWSDRNKATMLLGFTSASRDPALMATLRARSMPALVEMCRWGTAHGEPSCLMLQRVLGLPDDASVEARLAIVAAAAALMQSDIEGDAP